MIITRAATPCGPEFCWIGYAEYHQRLSVMAKVVLTKMQEEWHYISAAIWQKHQRSYAPVWCNMVTYNMLMREGLCAAKMPSTWRLVWQIAGIELRVSNATRRSTCIAQVCAATSWVVQPRISMQRAWSLWIGRTEFWDSVGPWWTRLQPWGWIH